MSGWMWAGAAIAAVLVLVLLRRPLAALGRLALRSGVGLAFLWLLQGIGPLLGIQLGVNLLNGLVLGLLGVPGFALLLLVRWMAGS